MIPAYEPADVFCGFVERLSRRFARIVVVNDGSSHGLGCFDRVAPFVECVLVHPVNLGKGEAIKTALRYLGDETDVVTADADGQHAVEDIVRVAAALRSQRAGLVLGSRRLVPGRVPFRSWWGNAWTVLLLFLFTRLRVGDTQTGLRGIPSTLVPRVRSLPGSRYEYEMTMLADARHHAARPLIVPVETIYLAGNAASHFSPLKDTLRIYRALIVASISPNVV